MLRMIFNDVLNNWKKAYFFLILAALIFVSGIVRDVAIIGITALFVSVYIMRRMAANSIKEDISDDYDFDYDDFDSDDFEAEISGTGLTIKDVENEVCVKLGRAYPGSKWRWICCPERFAEMGGIARISTEGTDSQYIDVDLTASGEIFLHKISPITEITPIIADEDTPNQVASEENIVPGDNTCETPPTTSIFTDEDTITKWCNIVLEGTLFEVVSDLNSVGYLSLYITADGDAFYVNEEGEHCHKAKFEGMPDVALWGHISDKLIFEGLFAEEREGKLFVSWPN